MNAQRKFCSNDCSTEYYRVYPTEEERLNAKRRNGRAANATYRTKLNNNTGYVSLEEQKKIKEFYDDCPIGYEVDHIYPVSKGGHHRISNLQYLTITENRKL